MEIEKAVITEEIKWTPIRHVRKNKLSEADDLVNMAMDNGVDVAPFRQYRQALRDIPQTYTNPEDVVWPQKPSLPQASV
ncbi:phage tail assembly chaperone [Vibrio cyclitrophicus]|uniref:phage tail assembly chaperone n=1 Tax=Vibrio cyclitrophicus TaxID=47951 RepID=UPI000318E97F|nr:phage tail assembly chaperone [Vibrio cyclitrophicus]